MSLREQLARAYESPAWDGVLIDRLAAEIAAIERALAVAQRHVQAHPAGDHRTPLTTSPRA
jgi:hypothetical protein